MSEISATLKISDFSHSPRLDAAAEYLRVGLLDEARAECAAEIAHTSGRGRLEAVLLLAKVELAARDCGRLLALLDEFRPAFDAERDDRLFGWFFMLRGAARQMIAELTGSAEEAASAFMNYEQATAHYLRSREWSEAGHALNNMALMQHRAGCRAEARESLWRARACFADLPVRLAQVDDSEARMCMAEGDARETRRLSLRAASVFAEYGKDRLLTDLMPVLLWALATCENAEGGEER